MLLAELVDTSATVAATRSRTAKVAAIADVLRRTQPTETAVAAAYLAGELPQRRLGIGWAALRDLRSAPASHSTLAVLEVHERLTAIEALAGKGSVAARRDALGALFGAATAPEQEHLSRLVSGELRQGALAGVLLEAVAVAADLPAPAVRRAAMLAGDLAAVAELAVHQGLGALEAVGLQVGRPVLPMLAQSATDVADALTRTGPAALEWKLDGVRVQVHRSGSDVGVFTRTLDDITARVPEVVEAVLALPVDSVILDGEAIALRPDGRPRPFQETASRAASRGEVASTPLTTYCFDVLHLDGHDLIDESGQERYAAAAALHPIWVPRLETADPLAAQGFFEDTLAAGHEGVVVKALSSPYEAGRRGAGWVKVKPRHTFDLVVLAAEWGHGRRQGWLSNLHLGARSGDGFVMLGKTFKGLTDELLQWQTAELLAREESRQGITVQVRPELVVEIAIDGVQRSTRYPGGVALRFARVLRYRPDKTAAEADTLESVLRLHPDA